MTALLPARSTYRAFSFGGGRQSVAVLVLAAQRKVFYDSFVFCNVGAEAESPDTLAYYTEHVKPFAARHGLNVVEISKKRRNGTTNDLYQEVCRDTRSIQIPVYVGDGSPGKRTCTTDWKIRLVDRYIRQQQDVTHAIVGIGFSLDEIARMRTQQWVNREPSKTGKGRALGFWKYNEYPLLDARMRTTDCVAAIKSAGLPEPPKSSCWFCPFHSISRWRDLRETRPELFNRAVEMERHILDKREAMGRDPAYLTRYMKPLEEAVAGQQDSFDAALFACEAGVCHT